MLPVLEDDVHGPHDACSRFKEKRVASKGQAQAADGPIFTLALLAPAFAQELRDGVTLDSGPVAWSDLVFAVPGAPDGCSSSYVLPLSHPMMAPDAGVPFKMNEGRLTQGPSWAACTQMTTHDLDEGVWIFLVWEPAFRGDLQCQRDGFSSPRVRVSSEDTSYSNEVKVRWNEEPTVPRGEIPSGASPCSLDPPPPRTEPTPGVVSDPLLMAQPRWSAALFAAGGKASSLGGFAYATRVGLGKQVDRRWLGPALEFHSTQAAPWPGEGIFATYGFMGLAWSAWDLDEKGRLRVQAALGGGAVRYQHDPDNARQGELEARWAPAGEAALALQASVVTLQAAYVGPGIVLCEPDWCTDMRHDLQLTVGLTLRP